MEDCTFVSLFGRIAKELRVVGSIGRLEPLGSIVFGRGVFGRGVFGRG